MQTFNESLQAAIKSSLVVMPEIDSIFDSVDTSLNDCDDDDDWFGEYLKDALYDTIPDDHIRRLMANRENLVDAIVFTLANVLSRSEVKESDVVGALNFYKFEREV